jgi:hypothetical protein
MLKVIPTTTAMIIITTITIFAVLELLLSNTFCGLFTAFCGIFGNTFCRLFSANNFILN